MREGTRRGMMIRLHGIEGNVRENGDVHLSLDLLRSETTANAVLTEVQALDLHRILGYLIEYSEDVL